MSTTNGRLEAVPAPSTSIEIFVALSSALTGFSATELWGTGMVESYYDEMSRIIGERSVGRFLGAASDAIANGDDDPDGDPDDDSAVLQTTIIDDPEFGPVAQNVLRLWYLGEWAQMPEHWRTDYGTAAGDHDHILSAEAYRQSLVWPASRAHPQGAKQQGFGSWAVPEPDDSPGPGGAR